MVSTVARIGEGPGEGGLIRRQKLKADGPNEGVVLPVLVLDGDCLNARGRHDDAVGQFERLLSVGNDFGLFSEEYDVHTRRQMGTFLQALTHLAIVNTALGLSGPVLNRGGG